MVRESTQKKLSRVRPPRVQITYDVEVGDAIETKELPFVLGVLGDYTGHAREQLPRLKERKFVAIDRDNFDDVMKALAPRLGLRVPNRLSAEGGLLGVELGFAAMEDFEPQNVVAQFTPLRRLLEARQRLAELRNKLVGSERFEALLHEAVADRDALQALKGELDARGGTHDGAR